MACSDTNTPLHTCQGATWSVKVTVRVNNIPLDLTGYSAKMDIKISPDAEPIAQLTTGNGKISITTPLTGEIFLKLTAAETAAMEPGVYLYDLFITDDSSIDLDTDQILKGSFEVAESVTT